MTTAAVSLAMARAAHTTPGFLSGDLPCSVGHLFITEHVLTVEGEYVHPVWRLES